MVDPAAPGERINVNINQREAVREIKFAWSNYTDPLQRFNFVTYLRTA